MSYQAIKWVLNRSRATGAAWQVAIVLAEVADENGDGIWLSLESTAERANMGQSTARKGIGELLKSGELIANGPGPRGTRAFSMPLIEQEKGPRAVRERPGQVAPHLRRTTGSDTAGSADPPQDLDPRRIEQAAPQDVAVAPQELAKHPAGSAPEPPRTTIEPPGEPPMGGRPASRGHLTVVSTDPVLPGFPTAPLEDRAEAAKIAKNQADRDAELRVFDAWMIATGKTGKTVFDEKRRRWIRKALDAYPEQDVIDAVRGWRWSPWHNGENPKKKKWNELDLLLREGKYIEMFRDLEREHSANGGGSAAANDLSKYDRAGEAG